MHLDTLFSAALLFHLPPFPCLQCSPQLRPQGPRNEQQTLPLHKSRKKKCVVLWQVVLLLILPVGRADGNVQEIQGNSAQGRAHGRPHHQVPPRKVIHLLTHSKPQHHWPNCPRLLLDQFLPLQTGTSSRSPWVFGAAQQENKEQNGEQREVKVMPGTACT